VCSYISCLSLVLVDYSETNLLLFLVAELSRKSIELIVANRYIYNKVHEIFLSKFS
jgi:hypothetical protein